MNLEQIQSLIRTLLAAGGPIVGLLVKEYGMPYDRATTWVSLALAILPPIAAGVWGILNKTDQAKVLTAGAMPGVTVSVAPNASEGAKSAAAAAPTVILETEAKAPAVSLSGGYHVRAAPSVIPTMPTMEAKRSNAFEDAKAAAVVGAKP